MLADIVLGALVIAVTGRIVTRVTARRRGDAPSVEGTTGRAAGTWAAASPIEGAFPIERTPRERNIGDAAFVDGLVVGYYFAPYGRDTPGGQAGVGSGPAAEGSHGDDDADDAFDDGFGFDDGLDDDW